MSILDRIRQSDKQSEETHKKSQVVPAVRLVLRRPMVTEKASALSALNQYVFEIDRNANKLEVKAAVEKQYGVKPNSVNIVRRPSKTRTRGRITGKTGILKKAIVTLPAGKTIAVAETK